MLDKKWKFNWKISGYRAGNKIMIQMVKLQNADMFHGTFVY